MFILNETNYSDGKATFYDNAGTVVEGGTLKIFSPDDSVAEYAIDQTGVASFSIERMILYRFEIYSADGELVSVLDPVMYESVESSGMEGGESVEDYGERIGDLERALNRETDARKRSDDGIRSSIADVNADVAGLRAGLENEANLRSTHEQRTDNPHQVTAEQVGAATSNDLLRMRYAATNTLRFYRGVSAI